MNKVILSGRLTKNPELQTTTTGKNYCKFSLAVSRYVNGQNSADFINCIVWGKMAENLVNYQTKGSLIFVEGNILTGKYTDKNGAIHYTTDILVEKLEFTAKVEKVEGFGAEYGSIINQDIQPSSFMKKETNTIVDEFSGQKTQFNGGQAPNSPQEKPKVDLETQFGSLDEDIPF